MMALYTYGGGEELTNVLPRRHFCDSERTQNLKISRSGRQTNEALSVVRNMWVFLKGPSRDGQGLHTQRSDITATVNAMQMMPRRPVLLGASRLGVARSRFVRASPRAAVHAQQQFSTAAKPAAATLTLPPNLTIDARSTCSPIHGLERVRTTRVLEKEQEDDVEGKERPETEEELVDNDDDEEEYSDNDDEEIMEELIYNLSTRPEPYRAIPLPDRLHVPVHDMIQGDKVGTLYLSERIFGHDDIRVDLLARTVQYQRNQKRGKRKAITKTISQVSGSGRKVRQQKGSGRARAGHSRPAHWRGGAKAHGPKGSIQDYANCKLNKRAKRLALTHALSQKLKEGNLILLNHMNVPSYKTKELAKLLDRWDVGGRYGTTAYLVDHVAVEEEKEENVEEETWKGVPVNLSVASQNIYKVHVSNQLRTNVYDILKHEKLVMTVQAVTALEARLEGLLRY